MLSVAVNVLNNGIFVPAIFTLVFFNFPHCSNFKEFTKNNIKYKTELISVYFSNQNHQFFLKLKYLPYFLFLQIKFKKSVFFNFREYSSLLFFLFLFMLVFCRWNMCNNIEFCIY
jgi:hypothetical protein